MIQQLCRLGVTVVQVTHRIDTIVPEMKRVVLLKAGQVRRRISEGDADVVTLERFI